MIVKLLTAQDLEFLSLKGGYRGSSKSTFVKMSNCWKSIAAVHLLTSPFRIKKRMTPASSTTTIIPTRTQY